MRYLLFAAWAVALLVGLPCSAIAIRLWSLTEALR